MSPRGLRSYVERQKLRRGFPPTVAGWPSSWARSPSPASTARDPTGGPALDLSVPGGREDLRASLGASGGGFHGVRAQGWVPGSFPAPAWSARLAGRLWSLPCPPGALARLAGFVDSGGGKRTQVTPPPAPGAHRVRAGPARGFGSGGPAT